MQANPAQLDSQDTLPRMRRAVLVSDMHIPHHDPYSVAILESMLNYLRDTESLTDIVIMGDFLEIYALSFHDKDNAGVSFYQEIVYGQELLAKWKRNYPGVNIHYICGNHEHRVYRFIAKNCPELKAYAKIEELLELEKIGVNFIPYTPTQAFFLHEDGCMLRHESIVNGQHIAAGTVVKALCSVAFGHTHRLQMSCINDWRGNTYTGYSLGCLINFEDPIFDYYKTFKQWQSGFGVYNMIDERWYIELIQIKQRAAMLDGIEFRISESSQL